MLTVLFGGNWNLLINERECMCVVDGRRRPTESRTTMTMQQSETGTDSTMSRRRDFTDVHAADGSAGRGVRVLVCRLDSAPVVEALQPDDGGDYLTAMQAIVGGLVQVIQLENGIELWCNEEGLYYLPLNRVIPAQAPPIPPGFEDAVIIRCSADLAMPGEPGEWRIHGDFFLARSTVDGELADVTDEDIAHYQALWGVPSDAAPHTSSERGRTR
jgi:hypothetical protein